MIVLKTSQFREEEAEGIFEALDGAAAELRDLVWVQESYSVKVLRDGNYPVMRGTFVELDGKGLLYTNGSIPYYGTYAGMYDPKPLLLCPYKGSDSTIAQIARSVGPDKRELEFDADEPETADTDPGRPRCWRSSEIRFRRQNQQRLRALHLSASPNSGAELDIVQRLQAISDHPPELLTYSHARA